MNSTMKQLKVYLDDEVLVLDKIHGKWNLEIYHSNNIKEYDENKEYDKE